MAQSLEIKTPSIRIIPKRDEKLIVIKFREEQKNREMIKALDVKIGDPSKRSRIRRLAENALGSIEFTTANAARSISPYVSRKLNVVAERLDYDAMQRKARNDPLLKNGPKAGEEKLAIAKELNKIKQKQALLQPQRPENSASHIKP